MAWQAMRRQLVSFVQSLPSPEMLNLHQLLLYGRGLFLQQEKDKLDSLLASLPSLLLTQLARLSQFSMQLPEQRDGLSRVLQELYDLRTFISLLSPSLTKSKLLNRMAYLHQNLPAQYESCSSWRLLLHWREVAYAKFDEWGATETQQVRGDVEWHGLRLIEKFIGARDLVGVAQIANELLQRKWVSVSALTQLISVMVDTATATDFEVNKDMCTHANLSLMQVRDKVVIHDALASLLNAKQPADAYRSDVFSVISEALGMNPDNGALWRSWNNLLASTEPMKDVVAAMVASLEKGCRPDARMILKLLNCITCNKITAGDLNVVLDQCPSHLFLPFLPLLFPIDANLFQLFDPVRRIVRRDHGELYMYYLKWRHETCLQRGSTDTILKDVGMV